MSMLTEICAEIRNYFVAHEEDKHYGYFEIQGGNILPPFEILTDYVRIVGSHKNDGVHERRQGGFDVEDEGKFAGAIWVMSPPPAFLDLVNDIELWVQKNGTIDSLAMSPYDSESFGGYAYSKSKTTNANGASVPLNWQTMFASRLNIYRKIRVS